MIRFEALAIAIGSLNGAFDSPESKAFRFCNPGMLRTYRPEKRADSEHYRIFSSMIGGLKALTADLQAKCGGKNQRLTVDSTLRDLLGVFGFANPVAARKITLFLRRALQDETIELNTPIGWFKEVPKESTNA